MRRGAILLCCSAAIAGAGIGPVCFADAAALERLEAARERWQASQTGNYLYGYRKFCDCNRDLPPETVVTVAAGRIVSVSHRHEDTATEVPAREGSLELYWTIDALFDKLAGALAAEAVVRVDYEPERGFPTALFIDYDPAFAGDETDLRLTRVELP
jgi:Family of unknown function (DUF6174)